MKKEATKPKKPFFARYLESQELEEVCGGKDWPPMQTMKYPSDSEDGGGGDPVTLKYPSDGDDDLPSV